MTTSIRFNHVLDIGSQNDVLQIPECTGLQLSAYTWTFDSRNSIAATRKEATRFVLEQAIKNSSLDSFWLVSGSRASGPDSRIIRHYGYWKSLQRIGILLPECISREESVIEHDGLVSLVGAMQIDADIFDKADKADEVIHSVDAIMHSEQAGILLASKLDGERIVQQVLRHGIGASTKPPVRLLQLIEDRPAIVVLVFGSFDDVDVLVAAIGNQTIITNSGIVWCK